MIRRVLSIAGSDSGGGAGIQADLKAFARCGVHGMTAITAITAQSTVGVTAVHPVPPDVIVAQVDAVRRDIGVDAVKIGMLADQRTIAAVSDSLDLVPNVPVVLDPVMVAESGAVLLDPEAIAALRGLIARVTVITPNIPEARELAGDAPPEQLARDLFALGPRYVVVTGGHSDDGADLFFDGTRVVRIEGELHRGGATHGSGCTHSSALAAQLALGAEPLEAARVARRIASDAVRDGLRELGAGAGPVDVLGLSSDPASSPPDGARQLRS